MSRIQVGDIELYVEERGTGAPLLLLHGFMGSSATWHAVAPRFAEQYRTVAVDVIGHGRSDAPPSFERYRVDRCVHDLLALLDALHIPRTAVLGYSMGGRLALHLAAAAPTRVTALVLESTSPGIDDPQERAARRDADEKLAQSIERDGLEAFIRRWEALPLFASQRELPQAIQERQRRERLNNRPHGLAASLRGMGTGVMEPLWDELANLTMPVFVMMGELDVKFCQLGSRMAQALPAAEQTIIPRAGHNVHLEQPDLFVREVMDFLQRRYPSSP